MSSAYNAIVYPSPPSVPDLAIANSKETGIVHHPSDHISSTHHQEPISPLECDEFAYPSNLASGPLQLDSSDDDYNPSQELSQLSDKKDMHSINTTVSTKTSRPTSTALNSFNHQTQGTTDAHDWEDDLKADRGHFRANNVSTGSDLIQVTVEDLLISEEQVRTIKASTGSYKKKAHNDHLLDRFKDLGLPSHSPDQQQDTSDQRAAVHAAQAVKEAQAVDTTLAAVDTVQHIHSQKISTNVNNESSSSSSSSPASPTSPRSFTITATIRGTGNSSHMQFSFENEPEKATPSTSASEQPTPQAPIPTKPKTSVSSSSKALPNALTSAQQREAEVDALIQTAIELHEKNQLVEATRHFRLAAQSENPLGQLMYGLSLRHGWGCRANPTEAIVFLQRAAEFAMGELKELSPRPHPVEHEDVHQSQTALQSTDELQQQQQQSQQHTHEHEKDHPQKQQEQQQQQQQQQASKSNHTNLRRMGSLDRRQATIMARKELVMALYELGMSYLKGWGVNKDKTVAFNYFKIAADLGDPDSQNETALCYYEGIGVQKDMYQSAKYYRLAAAQGSTYYGNSWIWKPKYDQYCAAEAAAATIAVPVSSSSSSTTASATSPSSLAASSTGTGTGAGTSSRTGRGYPPLINTKAKSPHETRSRGSSKSRSSSPSSLSTTLTSPFSPSSSSHHHATLSGIAAGIASVTGATTGVVISPT
ncbi:hypothetical protein BGZ94_010190, partial [Podila epigama]